MYREISKVEFYLKYAFAIMTIAMAIFYIHEYLEHRQISMIILGTIGILSTIYAGFNHHRSLKKRILLEIVNNFEEEPEEIKGVPQFDAHMSFGATTVLR